MKVSWIPEKNLRHSLDYFEILIFYINSSFLVLLNESDTASTSSRI